MVLFWFEFKIPKQFLWELTVFLRLEWSFVQISADSIFGYIFFIATSLLPWDTFSFPQQKRPHVSKALLPLYKAMGLFYIFQKLKGTVSVNSSEPPWKYCNARFTTVPLTPYLINNVKDIFVILGLKVCKFSCSRKVSFVENFYFKIISFRNYKHWYIIYTWLDKAYCYKSGNAIFAWRVTLNYAYSNKKKNF